jgi:hypothetical protein
MNAMRATNTRNPIAPLLTVLLLLAPAAARADGGVDADRPDFTNGPRTVEPGAWQLEAGATRVTASGVTAWTAGEALLRTGVARGLELRLTLPTWNRMDDGSSRTDGLGDAGAGFKWTLPGASDALAAGVIADVTAPTGARGVGAGRTGGDLAFALDRAISQRIDATANVGLSRQAGETTLLLSTSWGADLGRGWGTWAEWAAFAGRDGTAHRFDTGLTLAVSPRIQLDARLGAGAGLASGETTLGAGVATRW